MKNLKHGSQVKTKNNNFIKWEKAEVQMSEKVRKIHRFYEK